MSRLSYDPTHCTLCPRGCGGDAFHASPVAGGAMAAAAAAMEDAAYFEAQTAKVTATRDRAAERLRALGFAVTDSKANFLFVHHPRVAAKALLDGLRQRGILVRWFDRPRISDYLRITVGTDEEMEALYQAIKALTEE